METTEEQRQRAKSNRLAALAKRKTLSEAAKKHDVWKLFKCRKVSPGSSTIFSIAKPPSSTDPFPNNHMPEKFRVRLEICSPNSFSVTPDAVEGFPYPSEAACLEKLSDCLSNV